MSFHSDADVQFSFLLVWWSMERQGAGARHYGYVMLVLCLLLAHVVSLPVSLSSGDLQHQFPMEVFQIAVDDLTHQVYVGGNNMVYKLTPDLQVLLNTTLVDCGQGLCENRVVVLEVDSTFRRLLVCGTAQQRLCWFLGLEDLDKRLLNLDDAFIDTGDVLHSPILRQMSIQDDRNASKWIIASSSSRSPAILSVTEIYPSGGSQFNMSLWPGRQSEIRKSNTRFKFTFLDGMCLQDRCVYLTLQQVNAESRTFISRIASVCRTSLFPYVETPFNKAQSNKTYNRPLAFTLAELGIVSNNVTERYFISVFGMATNRSDLAVNSREGLALGVMKLDKLISFKFELPWEICTTSKHNINIVQHPDWYSGEFRNCVKESPKSEWIAKDFLILSEQVKQCAANSTQNPVIQYKDSDPVKNVVPVEMDHAEDIGKVTGVFTHTHVLQTDDGNPKLDDDIIIYITTSSGRIFQFYSTIKGNYDGLVITRMKFPQHIVHRERKQLAAGLRPDMALTKDYYYLLSGTKVIRKSMDPCLVIDRCDECAAVRGCSWCSQSRTCQLKAKCQDERCPPIVEDLEPRSGPIEAQTELKIKGANIGPLNTTVSICDRDCLVNSSSQHPQYPLSCTVPSSSHTRNCTVVLTVTATGFSYSPVEAPVNFTYTEPTVSSVTPLGILQSERSYLEFSGTHLDTGASVTILTRSTVHSPVQCLVTERDRRSLRCRVPGLPTVLPYEICFRLSMTIDGYALNLTSIKHLCRFPNPEISSIGSQWMFERGMNRVEVNGTNLNFVQVGLGVTINHQQFQFDTPNCAACEDGDQSGTCLLCCMPDVSNLTSSAGDVNMAEVWFDMKGLGSSEKVDYSEKNGPFRMKVLPEPVFSVGQQSPSTCLVVSGPKVVKVQGSSLPAAAEYRVRVGGKHCGFGHVSPSSTSASLSCDLRHVWSRLTQRTNITRPGRPGRRRRRFSAPAVCTAGTDKDEDEEDDPNGADHALVVIIQHRRFTVGCIRLSEAELDVGGQKLAVIIGCSVAGAVLIFLTICGFCCYMRHKQRQFLRRYRAQHSVASGSSLITSNSGGSGEAGYVSLARLLNPTGDPKKQKEVENSGLVIQRKYLTLGNVVGHGNFGCVFEGLYQTDPNDKEALEKVAVKTLLDPVTHALDLQGFIDEAMLMKNFNHEHVLGLLGLSEGDRGPLVVLPYMERGDLLTYVKDEETDLSVGDVLRFARDISRGMDYLASSKFVHRDLAARNCMLDEELRVKVADFGLTRDVYEKGYYHSDNKKRLPIRWMAPESIEKGTYTSRSDVWALAVVIWEMYTRGIMPYPGVEGWDILRYLLAGRRMDQPYFCPDAVYALMERCWREQPVERPNFRNIGQDLMTLAESLQEPAAPNALCVNTSITFPLCHRFKDDAAVVEKVKVAMHNLSMGVSNATTGSPHVSCSGSGSGEVRIEEGRYVPEMGSGTSTAPQSDSPVENRSSTENGQREIRQLDVLEGKDDGYFLLERETNAAAVEASGTDCAVSGIVDPHPGSGTGRADVPSVSWRGQTELQDLAVKDDGYFVLEGEASSRL